MLCGKVTAGFPWLAQRMLVPIAFASKAALWCFVCLGFFPPFNIIAKVIYVTVFVILPEVTIKSDSKGRCTIKTGKGQLAE